VSFKSITSAAVIDIKLKRFFTVFIVVPEQLVFDNGKQFDSAEFRQFCSAFNILSPISSLEYPRSNGLEEKRFKL
jgi:transposase InsO family protein